MHDAMNQKVPAPREDGMTGRLRLGLTVELVLTLVSLGLCVLTLITREWIEKLTGLDPDAGSGTPSGGLSSSRSPLSSSSSWPPRSPAVAHDHLQLAPAGLALGPGSRRRRADRGPAIEFED